MKLSLSEEDAVHHQQEYLSLVSGWMRIFNLSQEWFGDDNDFDSSRRFLACISLDHNESVPCQCFLLVAAAVVVVVFVVVFCRPSRHRLGFFNFENNEL